MSAITHSPMPVTRIGVGRAVAIALGLLAAGLSVLVYANYQRDIHQARERVSVGSQIVETACGQIEYAVAGNGPTVLVVHGAGGGYDQGLDISRGLVRSGFRVVAMSRFGYLRTPLPFWVAPRLAPQAMYGALLATPAKVVESASADERARVAETLNHLLPFSARRLGVLNDASITPSLPRYELEQIGAPTLIAGAADDPYGTYDGARYSAEHIPNARFVGYPSGGHLLVGHLEETISEIASFLGRNENEKDKTLDGWSVSRAWCGTSAGIGPADPRPQNSSV
jgi:pimeloyl-ACP methyl ester carboxylesterase